MKFVLQLTGGMIKSIYNSIDQANQTMSQANQAMSQANQAIGACRRKLEGVVAVSRTTTNYPQTMEEYQRLLKSEGPKLILYGLALDMESLLTWHRADLKVCFILCYCIWSIYNLQ